MLRAGVFLDVENLVRCGGWGIRFKAVRELIEAQGGTVVRANAYMAVDREREAEDAEYRVNRSACSRTVPLVEFRLDRGQVHRRSTVRKVLECRHLNGAWCSL